MKAKEELIEIWISKEFEKVSHFLLFSARKYRTEQRVECLMECMYV